MKSLKIFLTKYCSGDEIRKNEIGRTPSTYVESTGAYRDWWGELRERDYLGDPGVDERVI
jgi:hypothetical protein